MTLPTRLADWPEAAREDYEERAAILEYEANYARTRADLVAMALVRHQWSPTSPAPVLSTQLRKPGPARPLWET